MENFSVKVANKFKEGKRGLHVFSSAGEEESFIHWPKEGEESRSETFDIPSTGCSGEENYLIITIPPRYDENGEDNVSCQVYLPSKSELKFISRDVTITPPENGNGETMSIEAGPPTWKLKVTRPDESWCHAAARSSDSADDNVTVGDNGD